MKVPVKLELSRITNRTIVRRERSDGANGAKLPAGKREVGTQDDEIVEKMWLVNEAKSQHTFLFTDATELYFSTKKYFFSCHFCI